MYDHPKAQCLRTRSTESEYARIMRRAELRTAIMDTIIVLAVVIIWSVVMYQIISLT